MQCFAVLLAVCPSVVPARIEENVRSTMDLPDVCAPVCQRPAYAFNHLVVVRATVQRGPALHEEPAHGVVLQQLALSRGRELTISRLRTRSPLGAADLELEPGSSPIAAVGAGGTTFAKGSFLVRPGTPPRLVGRCIPDQCSLVLMGRTSKQPIVSMRGGRSSSGEMGGQIVLGPWFRATGRVSFDVDNRYVVHIQDVGVGHTEVLGGRLAVGGIIRHGLRYFDTLDTRGISLSAEIGPVFGIHLAGSSHVLSSSITAGPDVLFTGQLSGTVNVGVAYTP